MWVVLLDTETTDEKVYQTHIVQLAGLMCELLPDGTVGDAFFGKMFETLVFTTREISPAAFAVHGIDSSKLKDQPDTKSALLAFERWVSSFLSIENENAKNEKQNIIYASHNGFAFDNLVLWSEFRRHGLDSNLAALFQQNMLCDTYQALRKFYAQQQAKEKEKEKIRSFRLGALHEQLCQEPIPGKAHDARCDVLALYSILKTSKIRLTDFVIKFETKFELFLKREQDRLLGRTKNKSKRKSFVSISTAENRKLKSRFFSNAPPAVVVVPETPPLSTLLSLSLPLDCFGVETKTKAERAVEEVKAQTQTQAKTERQRTEVVMDEATLARFRFNRRVLLS
jgi:DNA polymerase III epsilon subunit-like protein